MQNNYVKRNCELKLNQIDEELTEDIQHKIKEPDHMIHFAKHDNCRPPEVSFANSQNTSQVSPFTSFN